MEAAPRLCRLFLFRNSHAKNHHKEERQGERAGRAVLCAWRDSGSRHAIGACCFAFKTTTHASRA